MYQRLTVFFAGTTLLLAAVLAWLVAPRFIRTKQQLKSDEGIIFSLKIFVGTKAYVAAKGTLVADWIA